MRPFTRSSGRVLACLLVAGAGLGAVGAVVAQARWQVFRAGDVVLKFDGGPVPKTLPRHGSAPMGVVARLAVSTAGGTRPPALRGGVFDIDRTVSVDGRGLPVCKKGALEARTSGAARQACRDAIVGSGTANATIEFPESKPIDIKSPLIFFNGGVSGGTTTMFVHAYITVPVPSAIVTRVRFTAKRNGRYGMRSVTEIPKVAGGSGSLTSASFTLKRLFEVRGETHSFLNGGCPDGRIFFRVVSTEFELGNRLVGLPLSGSLTRPCVPSG